MMPLQTSPMFPHVLLPSCDNTQPGAGEPAQFPQASPTKPLRCDAWNTYWPRIMRSAAKIRSTAWVCGAGQMPFGQGNQACMLVAISQQFGPGVCGKLALYQVNVMIAMAIES